MATTTTRNNATPDMITSAVAAELIVAGMLDYADRLADDAATAGRTRTHAATVRMWRRTARQLADLHDLDTGADGLDGLPPAPPVHGEQ